MICMESERTRRLSRRRPAPDDLYTKYGTRGYKNGIRKRKLEGGHASGGTHTMEPSRAQQLFLPGTKSPLILSWTNIVLYTFQVFLAFVYIKWYSGKVKLYRYGIFAALVFDGLCTAAVLIDVYFVVTQLHGKSHPTGTMPTITILSYFPAAISQTFFMYRYYTLDGSRWLIAFLGFLITCYTTLSVIIATLAITSNNFVGFVVTGLKLSIAATSLCGATDVLIAGALIIKVSRIDSRLFYPKTKSILRRLALFSLACGVITSMFAVFKVIFVFTAIQGFTFMFDLQGRIYSLTTLANLIFLKSFNASGDEFMDETDGVSGGHELRFESQSRPPPCTCAHTDPTFAVVLGPLSDEGHVPRPAPSKTTSAGAV
ncbi:hypothetical protein CYLTODRAFT_486359 [Cylindrobasidium torrendii FP15055 ss-10]|uniref:DUF6534 domain-containing protein n=1 Tax=Cylindrobasidium torrendii FP15055 ss-10 TaxID=1314674 RepID=A0A0D7BQ11_9AGAR|nr:hypothetical protein CYLTODRAFT_486359 [Cylindrobasidium torrendii FP15055 ss-10]